jgi:hypothetical protein
MSLVRKIFSILFFIIHACCLIASVALLFGVVEAIATLSHFSFISAVVSIIFLIGAIVLGLLAWFFFNVGRYLWRSAWVKSLMKSYNAEGILGMTGVLLEVRR